MSRASRCKLVKIGITSHGGRVKSFGKNGSVTIAASKPEDNVDCMRLTPTTDGGVAVVGSVSFNNFDGTSAGVAYKFRSDGSRDPAFGVGGRVQGPDQDDFAAIAALPGGDFLIAGSRNDAEGASGPRGGIASRLDASGGLHDLLAASTLPRRRGPTCPTSTTALPEPSRSTPGTTTQAKPGPGSPCSRTRLPANSLNA